MMNGLIDNLESYLMNLNKKMILPFRYIVLHHSATPDGKQYSWDAIAKYHVEENGWNEIGYHFGVELLGDKYVTMRGRGLSKIGAHAVGFNSSGIGVCIVGDFDKNEAPKEQWKVAMELCKMIKKHINPKIEVIGHRETYRMLGKPEAKTCPGKMFNLELFKASV